LDDPLAHLPGYALRRAANATMAELAERLHPTGLRVIDASLLLLIGRRRDVTSSRIGRLFDIKRANMVPLLARLADAGLIVRVPIDGKSQAVVLTPAGEARRAEAQAITETFEAELLSRVPPAHRDHLLPALHALWRGP
jgi:DNA-binding MarR family transcriptional regulator